MASMTQQQVRYARIPTWLRELDFVTDSFTWLFRLMSRGAEALMTFATIFIIVETGVSAPTSGHFSGVHNVAIGIMIAAPEIILPGGFILAGEIKDAGSRSATLLYGMCWLFVILTGVTLGDVFVWHLAPTDSGFAALMWGRCVASVGYSILFRVITYRVKASEQPGPALLKAPDVEALVEQKLSDQALHFQAELAQKLSDQALHFQAESDRKLNELSAQIEATFRAELAQLSAQKLQETAADSSEPEASELAQEDAPRRRYLVSFEEASVITGMTELQLKRRVKSGEIEVTSAGKIKVKSLQDFQQKPRKVQRQKQPLQLLQKKEA